MDRAASDPCSLLNGALALPPGYPLPPNQTWPCPSTAKSLPAVGLTRAQGLAIKALLDAKKAVTATVKVLNPEDNVKVGGASRCRTGTTMNEAFSLTPGLPCWAQVAAPYMTYDGTSMACPYAAAGVVGAAFRCMLTLCNSQLLESTVKGTEPACLRPTSCSLSHGVHPALLQWRVSCGPPTPTAPTPRSGPRCRRARRTWGPRRAGMRTPALAW